MKKIKISLLKIVTPLELNTLFKTLAVNSPAAKYFVLFIFTTVIGFSHLPNKVETYLFAV